MSGRVFITGISGFIGRAAAAKLSSEGWSVAGVSRHPCELPGCEVVVADAADIDSFPDQLKRADVVLHLAAPTTFAEINDDPLATFSVNLQTAERLLNGFASGAGRQFIYLSSGKVYGTPQTLPINESHPLQPSTVLGKTKKFTEEVMAFFADYTGKAYTAVRLFNAYGPGQKDAFLIPAILRQVESGKIVLGDTRAKRDFIYIDDVVSGVARLINAVADNVLPGGFSSFNLGSGISYSAADIVEVLSGITGTQLTTVVDETKVRSGEAAEECADISKLAALGWTPAFDLRAGLEQTWRNRHWQFAKMQ
jgi:nucleoside-diphosphate-sugar epimerase